jgi:hypothetical protein
MEFSFSVILSNLYLIKDNKAVVSLLRTSIIFANNIYAKILIIIIINNVGESIIRSV